MQSMGNDSSGSVGGGSGNTPGGKDRDAIRDLRDGLGHYGPRRANNWYRGGRGGGGTGGASGGSWDSQQQQSPSQRDRDRELSNIYGRGEASLKGNDKDGLDDRPPKSISKSTSWAGGGASSARDYYGPSSASVSGGGGNDNHNNSGSNLTSGRGYAKNINDNDGPPHLSSRSKSFGADRDSVSARLMTSLSSSRGGANDSRGFERGVGSSNISGGSNSGPFSPKHGSIGGIGSNAGGPPERIRYNWSRERDRERDRDRDRDRERDRDRNRENVRGTPYGPGGIAKPRPSPTATSITTKDRGYSAMPSSSFTPGSISAGKTVKKSIETGADSIQAPPLPFKRSFSGDGKSKSIDSNSNINSDNSGNSSAFAHRRRASTGEQPKYHGPASGRFGKEEEGRQEAAKKESGEIDRNPKDDNKNEKKEAAKTQNPPQSQSNLPPSKPPPPASAPNTLEGKNTPPKRGLPSLTCSALGSDDKARKAEGIVSKMLKLVNKAPASSETAAATLPSKNEILKCMAVIDSKIKVKDMNATSKKKEVKDMEQKEEEQKVKIRLEIEREEKKKAREEAQKRQKMENEVENRKSERDQNVEHRKEQLMKLLDFRKSSMGKKRLSDISNLEKNLENDLESKFATLDSKISSMKCQLESAEQKMQELDSDQFYPESPTSHFDDNFREDDLHEGTSTPEIVPETAFSAAPTKDTLGDMAQLINSVLTQNQRLAAQANLESLAAIPYFPNTAESEEQKEKHEDDNPPKEVLTNEQWSNRARQVKGLADALYVDPVEVPSFETNNKSFIELAPRVKECIRAKNQKLKSRWLDLAEQYVVRQMTYNEEMGLNTETSQRGGFFSVPIGKTDEPEATASVRGNNPYRRPRRGITPGDVVRSEYEQEQIIAEITAKEAMEKRIKEGGCALPRQRGWVERRLCATYSNGFFGKQVDDWAAEEEELKHLNIWSDIEKCIFLDRFLHHPKDFRKIASFLKYKTTKDCIRFYYDSKKTVPYKHALKEFLQRKKRRGDVVSWDATIQSALSVGAIIKAGKDPEKPLKFLLPSSDYTYHTKLFHPMSLEIFNGLDLNSLNSKGIDEVKAKEKQKRVNWFILDAPSRKFLKQGKEDKEHNSSKRKLQTTQDREESEIGAAPQKQRTLEKEYVHSEPPSKKSKNKMVEDDGDDDEPIIDLKKHSTKAHKWTDDEKKLFFEAVGKFGQNWAQISDYVGTRTATQIKNYFYDNRKQLARRKEKLEKLGKVEKKNPSPHEENKVKKKKKTKKSKKESDLTKLSAGKAKKCTKNDTISDEKVAFDSNETGGNGSEKSKKDLPNDTSNKPNPSDPEIVQPEVSKLPLEEDERFQMEQRKEHEPRTDQNLQEQMESDQKQTQGGHTQLLLGDHVKHERSEMRRQHHHHQQQGQQQQELQEYLHRQELMKQEQKRQELMHQEQQRQELMQQEQHRLDLLQQEKQRQDLIKQEQQRQELIQQEHQRQDLIQKQQQHHQQQQERLMRQRLQEEQMMKHREMLLQQQHHKRQQQEHHHRQQQHQQQLSHHHHQQHHQQQDRSFQQSSPHPEQQPNYQWLMAQAQAQFRQQQNQQGQGQQGGTEWQESQQLHNNQSLMAVRCSPTPNNTNFSMPQGSVQFGSNQSSETDRVLQSRIAAAAAAAGIPSSSLEAVLTAASAGRNPRLTANERIAMEFFHRLSQQGDGSSFSRSDGGGVGCPPHEYRKNDQYPHGRR